MTFTKAKVQLAKRGWHLVRLHADRRHALVAKTTGPLNDLSLLLCVLEMKGSPKYPLVLGWWDSTQDVQLTEEDLETCTAFLKESS